MKHGPRPAGVPARALVTLILALTLTACGGESNPPLPAPAPGASAPAEEAEDLGIEVIGLPEDVELEVVEAADGVENAVDLDFVSPVFTLEPAEQLAEPVTVMIELDNALPETVPVLVATRTSSDQAWVFKPGQLTSDLRHVEYTTNRLDQVGVLTLNLDAALASFQADVRNGLAPGISKRTKQPACAAKREARQTGYSVTSSKSQTLLWCFGLQDGKRVVRVTNRRLSPVQVAHPEVPVLEEPGGLRAFAAWLPILGTETTFLAPGRTATYDADLEPLSSLTLTASSTPAVQSLRLLQATVRATAARLAKFDTGKTNVAATVKALLAMPQCRRSLGKGSDALLAGCFSQAKLVRVFGPRAVLLSQIFAAPATAGFLRDQAQVMTVAQTGDQHLLAVKRAAPDFSTLAGFWSGKTRLLTISNEGLVTETLNSGVDLVIKLTYRLEDPVIKAGTTTAKATVTAVRVGNRKQLKGRIPRVGTEGTITLSKGIIRPPYLRTTYCDPPKAKRGVCGR